MLDPLLKFERLQARLPPPGSIRPGGASGWIGRAGALDEYYVFLVRTYGLNFADELRAGKFGKKAHVYSIAELKEMRAKYRARWKFYVD